MPGYNATTSGTDDSALKCLKLRQVKVHCRVCATVLQGTINISVTNVICAQSKMIRSKIFELRMRKYEKA